MWRILVFMRWSFVLSMTFIGVEILRLFLVLYQSQFHPPSYSLDLLEVTFAVSQGFWNAVVYSFGILSWSVLKRRVGERLRDCFPCCSAKETMNQVENMSLSLSFSFFLSFWIFRSISSFIIFFVRPVVQSDTSFLIDLREYGFLVRFLISSFWDEVFAV